MIKVNSILKRDEIHAYIFFSVFILLIILFFAKIASSVVTFSFNCVNGLSDYLSRVFKLSLVTLSY